MTITTRETHARHGASRLPDLPVAVVGAGPAGLTAAQCLVDAGTAVEVFEATSAVGGISQTVERDGWRFDIGGHRFFTKVPAVEAFWHRMLDDDEFLQRPRMSRIYYGGKLFDYPLRPLNALRSLGVVEAARCVASYLLAQVRPPRDQSTFEGWVSARFGWRLYRIFFKTYTEKVWGMPADQIQADWAAQRIKNLSLWSALRNALFPKRGQRDITTLIDTFQYPRLGPGMMWERVRDQVESHGVPVHLNTPIEGLLRGAGGVDAVVTGGRDGGTTGCTHVISSAPISELISLMRPAAPTAVRAAAHALRYRDFLTVALVVPEEAAFPDNWIYVHSPSVRVGRIQNFGSWSPYLVQDGRTCLGLEYFVNEGDDLWRTSDEDLVALAEQELIELGLAWPGAVERGYAVRVPKAYPVYDEDYHQHVETIRTWLEEAVPNVHPVGRNGMHKYNNQDHSMLTAMLTVDNIVNDAGNDIWFVNVEEDYHEGGPAGGERGTGRAAPVAPRRVA